MTVDQPRIEAAVREILTAIGEDPDRDGLLDTPGRVARMYAEVFAGLAQDAREPLSTTFDIEHQELVLVRDIAFYSMCEHHLLPFHGAAHVGYIPVRSPASASTRGWWTSTPAGRRCRSGSPLRSPTR